MNEILDPKTKELIFVGRDRGGWGFGDLESILNEYGADLKLLKETPITDLQVINERLDTIGDLVTDSQLCTTLLDASETLATMYGNVDHLYKNLSQFQQLKKVDYLSWEKERATSSLVSSVLGLSDSSEFSQIETSDREFVSSTLPKLISSYNGIIESEEIKLYGEFCSNLQKMAEKIKKRQEDKNKEITPEELETLVDFKSLQDWREKLQPLERIKDGTRSWSREVYIHTKLAEEAIKGKYTRPEVVEREENCLLITQGKWETPHFRGGYIPNDTILDSNTRVEVLEGPNNSGKTVDMKKSLYIASKALAGCWVPADYAKVSIRDKIILREKGIGDSMSAFMGDCLSTLDTSAPEGEYWLVGMDETFTSTEKRGGEALTYGLTRFNADNERTALIISSHYPDLSRAFTNDFSVSFNHFTFKKERDPRAENGLKVTFPHHKQTGPLRDYQYAIAVAQTKGFDEDVLKYAGERMKQRETATNN